MISIQGLNKTYASGTQAVKNFSLEVASGEIFALLGPNGAGKSTTIRILTTLSGFDSGQVSIAGHNVDSEPEQVRNSIGYVAQNTGIDFFLTGRENLRLQGQLYRMAKNEINARIEELAHYFDLTKHLDQIVASYSGGMRRKLDIAAALIHKPKVLFLDEPTLGLDTQSRQNLWQYIRKLNEELKLTILLTTHYLEEADRLSHRVGIIANGEIKIVDTPEALKNTIHGDIVTLHFETVGQAQQNLYWQLSQQSFVKGTMWEGNKVHLYVDNGVHSIPSIVSLAGHIGVDLPHISFARPTLDDVFVKYTGGSINASKEDSGEKWWEKWAGKGGGGKWANQWKKWQQSESGETATESENATNQSVNSELPSETENAASNDWQKWQKNGDKNFSDTKSEASPGGNPTWPNAGDWPSSRSTGDTSWSGSENKSQNDANLKNGKQWQNSDWSKKD